MPADSTSESTGKLGSSARELQKGRGRILLSKAQRAAPPPLNELGDLIVIWAEAHEVSENIFSKIALSPVLDRLRQPQLG